MAEDEDIAQRLSALEASAGELRARWAEAAADSAASRTLARGADRDVSEVRAELRAHTSVLNALRTTQVEHGRVLGGQTVALDALQQEQAEQARVLEDHTRALDALQRDVGDVMATLDRVVVLLER